jgi:CRISPR-associated endonuclease/helicase Cas3
VISFREFLRALDHPEPYDWQEAFAERCAAGAPALVVGVPTGAGKTSVVEALVWALAMQADRPASERTVGVRTVWAIDRRILVDEVHARASELADKLAAAQHDEARPLNEVAGRLAELGGGKPLVATRWRGGVDDPRELLGPLQPQIITSTVAQIGSRLLFRGYGVAPGSLPLAAGLAACDTTICLDEAHLAEPFRQTVSAIAALHAAAPAAPELPPTRTIMITATPSTYEDDDVVRLSPRDREQLADRYTGPKTARLADAGDRANERERVALLVEETLAHVEAEADSVACVVNTVRRARAVWSGLQRVLPDGVDLALLIGPQRPVDRDRILAQHRGKLFDRAPEGNQLVCVTTQTFEVGLDADVEAMVTESASMQALVQRLGRLNRSGRRDGRATIVRDPEPWLYGEHERSAWEWLSGHGAGEEIDVSVAALETAEQRTDWPSPQVRDHAPALTPEIANLLAQTSPRPGAWQEPDVEAYLSGVRAEPSADVAVCWRADLRPERSDADADEYRKLLLKAAPPRLGEQITLTVQAARALIAARCSHDRARNQAARITQDDADVDVRPPVARLPDVTDDPARVPFVVIHRGDVLRGTLDGRRQEGMARPQDLEPGDVVVLPAEAGGCDEFGLAPADARPAADVAADLLHEDSTVAPVRITPEALLTVLGPGGLAREWQKLSRRCCVADRSRARTHSGDRRRELTAKLVRELTEIMPKHPGLARLAGIDADEFALKLEAVAEIDVELDDPELAEDDWEETVECAGASTADKADDQEPHSEERGEPDERDPADPARPIEPAWVLVPKRIRHRDELDRSTGERFAPPTLSDHALAVHARLARELRRLSLPAGVHDALLLAARAHDHGKADPRFQDYFYSGIRPLGAAPLAKSEFGTDDPAASRRAARLAGLPGRFSHEGASVAVLADALTTGHVSDQPGDDVDLDLMFVAVGTHHGRARPLPPPPLMREHAKPPAAFAVEAAGVAGAACGDGIEAFEGGAWLSRIAAVNRRYGAWGAAYLVGLLVLADRAVSSEGH